MNDPRERSSPTPSGGERALRDARLAQALAHAPDAHLRPDAAVRSAVLQAAREAVAPAPAPRRWWQRLRARDTDGRAARMPWNAAFATLLVAGFVAVLWQGEPVPEAQLDSAVPAPQSAPVPAAPVPVPPAPEPAAPAATAPAGTPPAPAPDVARKVTPPRPAPAATPAAPVVPRPSRNEAALEKAESAPGAAAPSAAPAPYAPPAAPPPAVPPAAMAPPVLSAPAPAARAQDTAREAAESMQMQRASAPAPAARARAFAQPPAGLPTDWTHVRPLPPASSASAVSGTPVARAQAGALATWLQALREGPAVAGRSDAVPAGGAAVSADRVADARIELLQEGRVLGVLEIGREAWHYQPADAGERPRGGPLDAQAAAAWRAEIARLAALPR